VLEKLPFCTGKWKLTLELRTKFSYDNYNNVESENILHILAQKTPHVTLKTDFHVDHKKVAEIKC